MMGKLMSRGEDLARLAQQREIALVAQRLRALFGGAAVSIQDAQVLVSGRGMIKRWLVDPGLRFFGGALK